jgi:hypothetical protein
MKPITLVLDSYEAANWQLNIDSRANVQQIIVNGSNPQSVAGAGAIPVSYYGNYPGGSGNLGGAPDNTAFQWPLDTGGGNTQDFLLRVENLLGTRISSFTGAYQAAHFTVTGSPTGQQVVNPIIGAGNLVDGPNPDLIYNKATGEVKLDLSDLAAQYPKYGVPFTQERLFLALANQDSSFNVANFNFTGLGSVPRTPLLNANRLGVDWSGLYLTNYNGQLISLGAILPQGIPDASALRQYFAAAHYGTDFDQGSFDLLVVPEPNPFILGSIGFVAFLVAAMKPANARTPTTFLSER